jgi:hypothetical protein
MVNNKIKMALLWLILGPVLALILSTASWYVIEQLSPGKLYSLEVVVHMFPKGLLLSLMTPWGWLMYGGLLLMYSQKLKIGISCTVVGALLLGGFWPIWATDMALSLA